MLAKLAPLAILLVLLLGACHDDVPNTSPQPETAEPSPQSEAQVVVRTPQESEADPLQLEDREQSSTAQDSELQAADADSQARPAAEPETHGPLSETAIELMVPNRVNSVELFALPNVDWTVVAIRHPTQSITIVALAPLLPGDTESGWLLAETPDGTRGWVTTKSLQVQVEDLAHLPRLDHADVVAHATAREGAVIRRSPHDDDHCVLPVGKELEVAARSPDGLWFYVRPAVQSCADSNGRDIWRGWIPASDVEYAPWIDRAPVIHSYGMWMVPTDPALQPKRIPIEVRDNWESESWGFDPDDQSIVFVSSDESGNPVLKRYTTESTVVAQLPHGRGDILVAPSGGRVLVMATNGNEASGFGVRPAYTLTVVEPDGRTTDIGEAFLYCQCGRGHFLSAQAEWSANGRTVVFRDWGIPDQAEPGHDAGEFWLYRTDTGQRVDLFAEGVRRLSTRSPAVFHPDSESFYAPHSASGPKSDYTLRRLTLDGGDWPGFQPIPVDADVRVSPDGEWLFATTNDVLLLFTDQGELHSARSGVNPQWLPDSSHFVYVIDGQRMLGNIRSERATVIPVPGYPAWWRPSLAPDGEHIAVDVHSNEWAYPWWVDTSVVRIYNVEGQLRTTFRYTGCSQWHWSPDGSRLAVSARSNCSAP